MKIGAFHSAAYEMYPDMFQTVDVFHFFSVLDSPKHLGHIIESLSRAELDLQPSSELRKFHP